MPIKDQYLSEKALTDTIRFHYCEFLNPAHELHGMKLSLLSVFTLADNVIKQENNERTQSMFSGVISDTDKCLTAKFQEHWCKSSCQFPITQLKFVSILSLALGIQYTALYSIALNDKFSWRDISIRTIIK